MLPIAAAAAAPAAAAAAPAAAAAAPAAGAATPAAGAAPTAGAGGLEAVGKFFTDAFSSLGNFLSGAASPAAGAGGEAPPMVDQSRPTNHIPPDAGAILAQLQRY
jgi:hypothetical protein